MMPLKLTISAFGPYPNHINIDFQQFFDSGLFLITGPTGSGKTMIFDAIVFALYGKSSGQMRESDSLRCDHADKDTPTFVEYSFLLHEQIYTMKRSPKYFVEGRKTAKMPTAILTLPNGEMVEGVRECDHKIISILGVDEKQFKQIVMIAQGEFTRVIMSSSEEREKVLRDLFHTEIYQQLEEKLKERLKQYKDKYDVMLQRKTELVQQLPADIDDYQQFLHEQEKKLQNQMDHCELVEKEYETKNHQLQLYNIQNQRIIKLDNLQEQYQQFLEKEDEYIQLKAQIDQLKKIKETNYLLKRYQQEQQKTERIVKSIHDLDQEIAVNQKDYIEISKRYQQIDSMKKQKDEWQQQIMEMKILIDDIYRYQHDYQERQRYLQEYQIKQEEYKLLITKKERLENSVQKDMDTVNTEDRLKAEFGIAQQQFKQANERKVKIHELSQLNDQFLLESDRRIDIQETYEIVEKELYDEKHTYDEMEKQFYRKQAGIFASALEEGKPCPICGSLHHPAPAKLMDDDITSEKMEIQKRKVNRIRDQFNDCHQQLLLKSQLIKTIQGRIREVSKELHIDSELTKELFIKELNKTIMQERDIKKSYATMSDEIKYIQKLKKSIALSKKDLQHYESEAETKKQELDLLNEQIHKLEGRLDEKLAAYDVETQKDTYQKTKQQFNRLVEQIDQLQQNYDHVDKERLQLKVKKETLILQKEKQLQETAAAKKAYQQSLEQYEDQALFQQLQGRIDGLADYEKAYQDYMITRTSLQEQIHSLQDEVKDLTYIDLEDLQNQLNELMETISTLQKDIDQDKLTLALQKNKIMEIKKINQALQNDEESYQRYLDLANVTSGKNNARVSLERYVLAAYFEKILLYANEMMKKLTQNRYVLLRRDHASKGNAKQGLELDVFDYESGLARDVKTLSGGESFKAALSLALGLSRMIQDHAGGIELNTLFIDEGFGSLDQQSLDQAVNCLLELHQDNKLIGIISHVSELKDRIDRQIIISRERKESKIHII